MKKTGIFYKLQIKISNLRVTGADGTCTECWSIEELNEFVQGKWAVHGEKKVWKTNVLFEMLCQAELNRK